MLLFFLLPWWVKNTLSLVAVSLLDSIVWGWYNSYKINMVDSIGGGRSSSTRRSSSKDHDDDHDDDNDNTIIGNTSFFAAIAAKKEMKNNNNKKKSPSHQDPVSIKTSNTTVKTKPKKRGSSSRGGSTESKPRRELVIIPTKLDVLSGRGGETNKHEGNLLFRMEARELRKVYRANGTSREIKYRLSLVRTNCVYTFSRLLF
jgi:hypothetical protein